MELRWMWESLAIIARRESSFLGGPLQEPWTKLVVLTQNLCSGAGADDNFAIVVVKVVQSQYLRLAGCIIAVFSQRLLVTPCWKVLSGLICTRSHPHPTRWSRVRPGWLRVDRRPDNTFQCSNQCFCSNSCAVLYLRLTACLSRFTRSAPRQATRKVMTMHHFAWRGTMLSHSRSRTRDSGTSLILNSAVQYWIYKVWMAPGLTPIDQSASSITAEKVITCRIPFSKQELIILYNFFAVNILVPIYSNVFICIIHENNLHFIWS